MIRGEVEVSQDWRGILLTVSGWKGETWQVSQFYRGISTVVSVLKGIQFALEQLYQCRAEPRRISHSTGYQAKKMNWGTRSRSRHFKALRVSGFHCIERICQVFELQAQVIKQRNEVFTFIYQACNWLIPLSALKNSIRKQMWSLEVAAQKF